MIAVLDSGIGGLAIFHGLTRSLPQENFYYLADHRLAPYGPKPANQISDRVFHLVKHLVRLGANSVVVACNTATVATPIDKLRLRFPQINFVGVEPPIKPIVSVSLSKSAVLFATSATCLSHPLKTLLTSHAPNHKITLIPKPEWVSLVEEGLPQPATSLSLANTIADLDNSIDTIALGCTHFTFLLPSLAALTNLRLVDSTQAVINQTVKSHSLQTPTQSRRRFASTSPKFIPPSFLRDLLSPECSVEYIDL